MKVAISRLVLLCAAAAPASAQNTSCQRYGNTVNCQTQQRSGVDWRLALPQQGPSPTETETMAREGEARQRYAGRLVADGRCGDARKFALKAGDFALAKQVGEACTK